MDHNVEGQSQQQHSVLRLLTKNHQIEKFKEKSNIEEGIVVSDSDDDEGGLVMNFDTSSEENEASEPTAVQSKRKDQEDLPLGGSKIRCTDLNEESSSVDVLQELVNVDSSTTLNKEHRRRKRGSTRWCKVRKRCTKTMTGEPSKSQGMQQKSNEKVESEVPKEHQEKIDKENVYEKRVCPTCNLEFFDSYSFTLHVNEHTTNGRSEECDFCSSQLNSADSLGKHRRIYTGEKTFECSICKLKFTSRRNTLRHEEMHEETELLKSRNPAERLLTNFQDHIFISSSKSSETGENCSSVPKGSINITACLKENCTFKCPVCGKGFFSIKLVKSHMILHSYNPVQCPVCDITFENYVIYEKHSCSETPAASLLNFYKTGFQDFSKIPFSSNQFPLVAKRRCEKQPRNPSSVDFAYECHKCSKAFPSNEALYYHESSHEVCKTSCLTCRCDFLSAKEFSEHQLKHRLPEEVSSHPEKEDPSRKEDFLVLFGLTRKGVLDSIQEKPCVKIEFDRIQYFVHGGCSTEQKDVVSNNDIANSKSGNPLGLQMIIRNTTSRSPSTPITATTSHPAVNDDDMMAFKSNFSPSKYGPFQNEPLDLSLDHPLDLCQKDHPLDPCLDHPLDLCQKDHPLDLSRRSCHDALT